MEQLYSYIDYRRFLAEYYEEKRHDNKYLLWYLSYHLKLPTSVLEKTIKGIAHVPESTIPLMCNYFSFTKKESRYFTLMFRYATCDSPVDKERIFRTLKTVRSISPRIIDKIPRFVLRSRAFSDTPNTKQR